jgi:hypothetical protein
MSSTPMTPRSTTRRSPGVDFPSTDQFGSIRLYERHRAEDLEGRHRARRNQFVGPYGGSRPRAEPPRTVQRRRKTQRPGPSGARKQRGPRFHAAPFAATRCARRSRGRRAEARPRPRSSCSRLRRLSLGSRWRAGDRRRHPTAGRGLCPPAMLPFKKTIDQLSAGRAMCSAPCTSRTIGSTCGTSPAIGRRRITCTSRSRQTGFGT